ncbi:Type VII secretion system ESAT-6-like [Desulfitobacterium hafniense]|uniref:Type VII secretion system ESAT-6-like n=1 Tax=Desulfitobacterium hafniense TaxID=49338 RepID=A0A098BAP3_DESHA|nr:WXG100 family type VII secretion target [Desulfitobacterium hafniense]CDX04951.1 Type VII secretion system ESAT-6-like [Desulfitobacterium hafniense]
MAKQVVNTDRLTSAANKLRTVNNNITGEFRTLQNKAKQLDSNWKSAAGEAARTTMYQLFKNNEVRSTVLQNYINMLEQQVNPGYTNTETVNTKLADKFK